MDNKIYRITFNNQKYHLAEKMREWCSKNVGVGFWTDNPNMNDFESGKKWAIHQMFGNTTFFFISEIDWLNFQNNWK